MRYIDESEFSRCSLEPRAALHVYFGCEAKQRFRNCQFGKCLGGGWLNKSLSVF